MNMFSIILQQMMMMFALILFGFFLVKRKVITNEGARQISTILSMFVMPSTMINAYHSDFDPEKLVLLGWTVLASVLTLAVRILLCRLVLRKEERIDKYAAIFSNSGFFGIPIVLATIGNEGVFYLSAYIMVNNITQWTYGQYLVSGDPKAMTLRKSVLNPGFLGAAIGILLYITQFPLPEFLWNSVDSIAGLNTPLAMIIIGSYIANSPLAEVFRHTRSYLTVLLRLVITPVLSIAIIYVLPFDSTLVKLVVTIASVAPTAVNAAILGRLFGGDYEYGARLVVLTSLFSILTIPPIMQLAQTLYQ